MGKKCVLWKSFQWHSLLEGVTEFLPVFAIHLHRYEWFQSRNATEQPSVIFRKKKLVQRKSYLNEGPKINSSPFFNFLTPLILLSAGVRNNLLSLCEFPQYRRSKSSPFLKDVKDFLSINPILNSGLDKIWYNGFADHAFHHLGVSWKSEQERPYSLWG